MISHKRIRRYWIMVLVLCFLLPACLQNNKDNNQETLAVHIEWKDQKAISIRIPYTSLKGMAFEEARNGVKIQLEKTGTDVLGEFSATGEELIFRPLIPFTDGFSYKIMADGKPVYRFTIPQTNPALRSSVYAVYPTGKEVPENLLKMYIRFSSPMQEGHALENIYMIRNEKDTIDVFLDLQQELWNKERTIVTLWLDPGRIKRGLQPNERSGIPLQQGERYRMVIEKTWRNAAGLELEDTFERAFTVRTRDSICPSIDHWEILPPIIGQPGALTVRLGEQLDYLLLKNAIRILDSNGNGVPGNIETPANETEFTFFPDRPWSRGNYIIEIESRLEDLAGNNLNRLFDTDVSKSDKTTKKKVYQRAFSVQ